MPNESNPYESPTIETSRQTFTDEQVAATGRTPGPGAIALAIVIGLFAAIGAFVATCFGTLLVGEKLGVGVASVLVLSSIMAIVVVIGVPWFIIRWMRRR